MKLFGDLDFTARYLGKWNWTRGFVQQVREGRLPGVTFEGVVGKVAAAYWRDKAVEGRRKIMEAWAVANHDYIAQQVKAFSPFQWGEK